MRNVSWWISIPASSPVGGLILLYILHSFSEGPWVGLSSSCPHSGDLFVDITLVGILPFPVLPLHALTVLPRIVSLYLDSVSKSVFAGVLARKPLGTHSTLYAVPAFLL